MNIDVDKAKYLLLFQRSIFALENDQYQVLKEKEFVVALSKYLLRLQDHGYYDVSKRVVEKIGLCCLHSDPNVRAQALYLMAFFSERVLQDENAEFYPILTLHLAAWLKIETRCHSHLKSICEILQRLVRTMLELQLWTQVELLVVVLSQISSGYLIKKTPLRREIGAFHGRLADEIEVEKVLTSYISGDGGQKERIKNLLFHLGDSTGLQLIDSMLVCNDPARRFALLEVIPCRHELVVPAVTIVLKSEQPWYVICNSLTLIEKMSDPRLYYLAKPFLIHHDIRVQRQALKCITEIGGGNVASRLEEALGMVAQELKSEVRTQLQLIQAKGVQR